MILIIYRYIYIYIAVSLVISWQLPGAGLQYFGWSAPGALPSRGTTESMAGGELELWGRMEGAQGRPRVWSTESWCSRNPCVKKIVILIDMIWYDIWINLEPSTTIRYLYIFKLIIWCTSWWSNTKRTDCLQMAYRKLNSTKHAPTISEVEDRYFMAYRWMFFWYFVLMFLDDLRGILGQI